MPYDPRTRVNALVKEHGVVGWQVLQAYNSVDPFHVFFGQDINPDEYCGYAERFFTLLHDGKTIEDAVTLSFHESQWGEGWVTTGHVEEIVQLISHEISIWGSGRKVVA